MSSFITTITFLTFALSAIAIPISKPDQTDIYRSYLSARSGKAAALVSSCNQPGKGRNADGQCVRCDVGMFSPGKETICKPCKIGSYTTKLSSAHCRACPKKMEALVEGSSFCTKKKPTPPAVVCPVDASIINLNCVCNVATFVLIGGKCVSPGPAFECPNDAKYVGDLCTCDIPTYIVAGGVCREPIHHT